MVATAICTTAPIMPPPTRHMSLSNAPAADAHLDRIVLTGFMGSGKSTIGRLLAERLGWDFVDLDTLIEQRTGSTIAQLFADRGEASFRQQETTVLASALRQTHVVLALGGGAPETLANRLLLEQTPATATVFLSAPFTVLAERCEEQAADPAQPIRPLLRDLAAAEARFTTRQPLYERLAHITIRTDHQAPEETAAAIVATLASPTRPA